METKKDDVRRLSNKCVGLKNLLLQHASGNQVRMLGWAGINLNVKCYRFVYKHQLLRLGANARVCSIHRCTGFQFIFQVERWHLTPPLVPSSLALTFVESRERSLCKCAVIVLPYFHRFEGRSRICVCCQHSTTPCPNGCWLFSLACCQTSTLLCDHKKGGFLGRCHTYVRRPRIFINLGKYTLQTPTSECQYTVYDTR